MDPARQAETAAAFRARHHAPPVLLLPNAWDALSARLFAAAGFDAIATTSGGVAWALGYPDGEVAPWPEVVAATARIVRAAGVAVSADIESGYGATAAQVAAHVGEIIAAGVAGINLEDSRQGTMLPLAEAAARLTAARDAAQQAGVPIVINARCDVFVRHHGAPDAVFDDAVTRGRAYLAAGADCIYPIGLGDTGLIAAYAEALDAPINVLGHPGMPDAATLGQLGVARITVGTRQTMAAAAAVSDLAEKLRESGDFKALASDFDHTRIQALFRAG